jgi:hypothetical protein
VTSVDNLGHESATATAATNYPYTTASAVAATAPISIATAESLPGTNTTDLVSGDALQVTFNSPVSVASTFSLTLTDGTDTGTITNADATAALSNSNMTVTYTLTGTPFSSPGALKVADLEALSQSGVSNAVGQWNLPGSANGGANPGVAGVSLANENRVFGGSNVALQAGPTFTVPAVGATSVTVTSCTSGDTLTVYNANGVSQNAATASCTTGVGTVTLSSAVTVGEVLLVTQTGNAGQLPTYESIASTGTVVPSMLSAVVTAGTADTSTSVEGAIAITYNDAVSCPTTSPTTDFAYSGGGAGSFTCTASGDVLTLTPAASGATSDELAPPSAGSTLVYTAPTTNSTSASVYAGASSAPVYPTTQTLKSTGTTSGPLT